MDIVLSLAESNWASIPDANASQDARHGAISVPALGEAAYGSEQRAEDRSGAPEGTQGAPSDA
ncbi:protein of unknown function [Aminobacter niigataensis]|nr:protein of unknown function [Aminobacter niigataensis]